MPKYMDVHRGFVGVTEAQLQEAHSKDLAIEKEHGVHFERAWLDPESGHVFCLSEAPNADAVRKVHESAGHPADEVHQVDVIVE